MPTATTTTISASAGQSREPSLPLCQRHSQNAAAAAIRNAALVSALAGSAQNDASVRSHRDRSAPTSPCLLNPVAVVCCDPSEVPLPIVCEQQDHNQGKGACARPRPAMT